MKKLTVILAFAALVGFLPPQVEASPGGVHHAAQAVTFEETSDGVTIKTARLIDGLDTVVIVRREDAEYSRIFIMEETELFVPLEPEGGAAQITAARGKHGSAKMKVLDSIRVGR